MDPKPTYGPLESWFINFYTVRPLLTSAKPKINSKWMSSLNLKSKPKSRHNSINSFSNVCKPTCSKESPSHKSNKQILWKNCLQSTKNRKSHKNSPQPIIQPKPAFQFLKAFLKKLSLIKKPSPFCITADFYTKPRWKLVAKILLYGFY